MKPKRVISGLLAIMANSAFAYYSATVNGVTWKYTVANGVAYIGTGENSPAISTSLSTSATIPSSLGGYTVVGIGGAAFSGCKIRSVGIPNSVTSIGSSAFINSSLNYITIPNSITSIGSHAFYNCQSLYSVVIPNSVTSIGSSAFYGCNQLTSVTIPGSLMSIEEVFKGCSGLQNVTISNGVTSIGTSAFYGCSKLTSIAIPDSVRSIEREAFYGCNSLTNVTIPASVTSIDVSAFAGCARLGNLLLPDGLLSIGSCAFSNCSSFTNVAIPASVTRIENGAFSGCPNLEEVTLQEGLSKIGESSFEGCAALAHLTIPDSVIEVGAQAFLGCDAILDATSIPGALLVDGWAVGTANLASRILEVPNLRGISDKCFEDCPSLEEVVFSEGLRTIGRGAFNGCTNLARVVFRSMPNCLGDFDLRNIEAEGSQNVGGFRVLNGWVLSYEDSAVTHLEIPDGIIGIAPYALSDFWDLEDVTLPKSLKYIGCGAFMNDTYLGEIDIPDGVEYIDDEAFKNCTYLRSVTIGGNLRRIGDDAFCNCSQLKGVSMPDSVVCVGEFAFSNCWRMASVKLPLGLEEIGSGMFTNCTSLVSAAVPTSRFTMKELFGEQYNRLTSVSILTGETRVCASAFEGCTAFHAIEIPEGITNCGDRAFYQCGVREVVFPDTVSTIGREILRNCTGLEHVILPRGLGAIPDYAFYTSSTALRSIVVPASVRYIGGDICYHQSGRLGCNALYFLGNAPEYDADAYRSAPQMTTYVVQGSRGWDGIPSSRDLPETWIGRPITFWTPTVFNATFNATGGKFSGGGNTVQCEEMTDTAFVIPMSAPTRIGYAFAGWWTALDGGTQIKITTRVSQTSEITIYAHWTSVEEIVAVQFDPNDGTGSMPNQTFTYGEEQALSSNQFVRAGHVFLGWSKTANSDVAYTDGEVIQNLAELGSGTVTLFAVWAIGSSNVTFTADGDKAWELARFARNGGAVWQSGAIGDDQTSVMEAHVRGNGTIAFDWQASCEDSFRGMRLDYLAFYVDGVEKAFVNGSSEWATESFVIEGAGEHVLRWVYVKDSEGSDYDDCGRVTAVTWTPSLNSLGDFLNASSIDFSSTGDALWSGQTIVSHDGVASLRSGTISDGGMTRLECTVSGPGEVSFWWKASCEAPFRGVPLDFVEFSVDGVQKEWIAGETDWTNAIVSVEGAGIHVLAWTYQKDDWEGTSDGEDCAWVDEVSWAPAADADVPVDVGGGKIVIVPGTWLSEKTTKAATDVARNGRKVWECYVLGLDPEDEESDFKITSFQMNPDGTVDLNSITIDPPKAEWNVQGATPVLKGKASLEGGEWQPVTEENKAGMRFFGVEVVLP